MMQNNRSFDRLTLKRIGFGLSVTGFIGSALIHIVTVSWSSVAVPSTTISSILIAAVFAVVAISIIPYDLDANKHDGTTQAKHTLVPAAGRVLHVIALGLGIYAFVVAYQAWHTSWNFSVPDPYLQGLRDLSGILLAWFFVAALRLSKYRQSQQTDR